MLQNTCFLRQIHVTDTHIISYVLPVKRPSQSRPETEALDLSAAAHGAAGPRRLRVARRNLRKAEALQSLGV